MKLYYFQSFTALTFILSFVVQSVNFRIFFTTPLFIAVVCHTSLFASFSLIVLGKLPEFRRWLLWLTENLPVDVDAQISLFEVILFDYLRWYTQDFENQISSAFCHCFFLAIQYNMEFFFPLNNFSLRVACRGWTLFVDHECCPKKYLVHSFFFFEISGTYILVFVQCVLNISLTALIWKLSLFAGSKAQDLLWLPKISLVLQRKWAWPLQPPRRYANFYSNHVGLLDYCS